MKLILCSQSPRRAQILRQHNFNFSIIPSAAAELRQAKNPEELPQINAKLKTEYVAEQYPDDLCLGADTMILFQGEIIGKPRDLAEAGKILRKLRGNTHQVITGVAIIGLNNGINENFSVVSEVTFRNFSDTELEQYLNNVAVLDKAGAYAIQEHGEIILDKLEGELNNVIGLPIKQVATILHKYLGD
ncbi:MAG: Maf family protein [Lentisphaeria bacterium]|nr:Maf family protein [Lentisphaeria bacterium]